MEKFTVTEQTTREDLVAALSQYEGVIEGLEKQIEEANGSIEALVADATKEAEATIEDLKKQLAAANVKADAAVETVKHNGTEYRIAAPKFRVEEKVYTAADLKKSPELVATLVEMGSGVLVPLVDREEKKKKK